MENKKVNSNVLNTALSINYRILNALINNPALLDNSNLSEEVFVAKSAQEVFKAIGSLYKLGETLFTKEQVYHEAKKNYAFMNEDIVSMAFDYDSGDQPTIIDDAIIQAKNAKKSLTAIKDLKAVIEELETGSFNDEALKEAQAKIEDTSFKNLTPADNLDIKKVYTGEQWMEQYEKETGSRRKGKLYPYGNAVLDELISEGATPGDCMILCSSTGMGKTTVVTNLLDGFISRIVPIPCILFSSEMSLTAMADRYISKKKQIPFREVVNAKDSDYDDLLTQVHDVRDEFAQNPYFRFCSDPCPTISQIEKEVRKFQAEIDRNYCIIFIDLLSMIAEFQKNAPGLNFAQSNELAMNKLNAMAKATNSHVIGTLQLNRTVESDRIITWKDITQKTVPMRSAIKNSNSFLERARTTIALWRPVAFAKFYKLPECEYEDQEDLIHFMMLKSNNNEIDSRQMLFVGDTFTLYPWTEEGGE